MLRSFSRNARKNARIWKQKKRDIEHQAYAGSIEYRLLYYDIFQGIHDRIEWPVWHSTEPIKSYLIYLTEFLDSDEQFQQFSPALAALFGRYLSLTKDGFAKMAAFFACFEVRDDEFANQVLAYALLTSKSPKKAASNLFKMWQQYTSDPNMPSQWSGDRLPRLQTTILDVGGEAGELVIQEFNELYTEYSKSVPSQEVRMGTRGKLSLGELAIVIMVAGASGFYSGHLAREYLPASIAKPGCGVAFWVVTLLIMRRIRFGILYGVARPLVDWFWRDRQFQSVEEYRQQLSADPPERAIEWTTNILFVGWYSFLWSLMLGFFTDLGTYLGL